MSHHSIRGEKTRRWLHLGIVFAFLVFIIPAHAQEAGRKLKSGTQPRYPELAKQFNIRGTARLELVITPDGKVKDVKVLGGSPVLAKAAVEAVAKWVYEPAPRESTLIVKFDFNP